MKNFYLLLFLCLSFFYACDRESILGSNLLGEDNIEIAFTDTLSISFQNNYSDSLRTWASSGLFSNSPANYRIGTLEDPVFGTTESIIYLCPNINGLGPDFEGANIDSMVLIIPLDSVSGYGDPLATHNIKVYQATEPYHNLDIEERKDTLFNNQVLIFDTNNLLGEVSGVFPYTDSVEVFSPVQDTLINDAPQLRIPIDPFFSSQFLSSMIVESDSMFQSVIKGLILESETDQSSLLGLSINNSSGGYTTDARLRLYHTIDTTKAFYDFFLAAFKHTSFVHDYSGTAVDQAIVNGEDDKLYIQALAGTEINIDFSNITQFDGKGINYAELELYLDETASGDLDLYPETETLIALYENESGSFSVISDISSIGSNAFNGGILSEIDDNGIARKVFKLRLTDHLVKIKNGTITNPIVKIIPEGPLEIPRRIVLHGNDNSDLAAKLKLVISEP